jgi:hypothetical protein
MQDLRSVSLEVKAEDEFLPHLNKKRALRLRSVRQAGLEECFT